MTKRERSEPWRMPPPLESALATALAAIEAREFTTVTLTGGERVALAERREELSDALVPAPTSSIRAALASLAAMPAQVEDDPAKARALFEIAVADLEDEQLPDFALLTAAKNFRMHKVPGIKGAWRPTAGQIRVEAVRIAAPWRHELRQIGRVLDAKAEPPRQRISKERFAELMTRIRTVFAISVEGEAL